MMIVSGLNSWITPVAQIAVKHHQIANKFLGQVALGEKCSFHHIRLVKDT